MINGEKGGDIKFKIMAIVGFEYADGTPYFLSPEEKKKFREKSGKDIVFADDFISDIKKEAVAEEKQKEKDLKHLQWIYDTLVHVHKEDKNLDYMIRFKEIIKKLRK